MKLQSIVARVGLPIRRLSSKSGKWLGLSFASLLASNLTSEAPAASRIAESTYVETTVWIPRTALDRDELANVVYSIATGLTTQLASASTLMEASDMPMRRRLRNIANELHAIPLDQIFPNETRVTSWTRIDVDSQPPTPNAAKTKLELANALLGFACGLKTQVIASPALAIPSLYDVKTKLSEIADELHGMQQDVIVQPWIDSRETA